MSSPIGALEIGLRGDSIPKITFIGLDLVRLKKSEERFLKRHIAMALSFFTLYWHRQLAFSAGRVPCLEQPSADKSIELRVTTNARHTGERSPVLPIDYGLKNFETIGIQCQIFMDDERPAQTAQMITRQELTEGRWNEKFGEENYFPSTLRFYTGRVSTLK